MYHLYSSAGEGGSPVRREGNPPDHFSSGSQIFGAYERDAREARDAVELLGDEKATDLMDEIVKLAQRMVQLEAALPPVRPYTLDFKTGDLAGAALYLGSGTLWNYLGSTVPRPEVQRHLAGILPMT